MLKLTDWFPGHIKPVRKGVYQLKCGIDKYEGYQYWDGFEWYTWSTSIDGAAGSKHPAAKIYQNDSWRGLFK